MAPAMTIDMNTIVGTHDLALITLDTLRYDVAVEELAAGRTPNLERLVGRWEQRHTPGSFTYAAHAAFFAGFLPTPARPGRHPRLFALRFEGSETTATGTCVLDGANIVEGLAARGYHTLCVGGVGFFNQQNALGRVFPSMFAEAHWSRATGVTDPRSFEHQIGVVSERLAAVPAAQRAFTFVNVAALHQPNHVYLEGATGDTRATHAAALRHVDRHVPALFDVLGRRGPLFAIVCSDHGTLYGDDDYVGHRIAHPHVMTVPYAEIVR
ncbi:MAG TPA: STM4013/SEN3800 family hydrolase [Kofleriaceae bacterium]|nr:STM4013/SEN3800 family hydrolase [Kofleriaceae bacterium]